MMFTDRQLELISEAVEDYSVLIDEDSADECSEILDIIEAHFLNKWLILKHKFSRWLQLVLDHMKLQEKKSFKFSVEYVIIC